MLVAQEVAVLRKQQRSGLEIPQNRRASQRPDKWGVHVMEAEREEHLRRRKLGQVTCRLRSREGRALQGGLVISV